MSMVAEGLNAGFRSRIVDAEARLEEIGRLMSSPDVVTDSRQLQQLGREQATLTPIVERGRAFFEVERRIDDNRALLDDTDDEMRALAEEELRDLDEKRDTLAAELLELLRPHDPNDERDVIMEIRAGTGGDEAALFAADLLRMYLRYAEARRWKTEIISGSESGLGGLRESIVEIAGRGAYSRLKFESGVHRVQRVPVTEASGRIHTSTATVAVLPEAEEIDIQIAEDELRVDVYRSTGHGGQSVNTTDSAVRITHLPSGMVVTCQDEKSQLKNKNKAMAVLRSRLFDLQQREQHNQVAEMRRSQVGTGERAEKIRTYNYRENRLTDHRIGLTLYSLDVIMQGQLDMVIDPLVMASRDDGGLQ
ncbi:MAG: peptide chain release factor 1 [Chloroflexi bacterium]|nr:peptide chain release factor 1 [Chloroflexota bacterium]